MKILLSVALSVLTVTSFGQIADDSSDLFVHADKTALETEVETELEESVIIWSATELDLGKIDQNKPVTVAFEFVNNGSEPITIIEAKGSCYCTGTTFQKLPVLAGETAKISATYNAKSFGSFNQYVTVMTSDGGKQKLSIKGEVVIRF